MKPRRRKKRPPLRIMVMGTTPTRTAAVGLQETLVEKTPDGGICKGFDVAAILLDAFKNVTNRGR